MGWLAPFVTAVTVLSLCKAVVSLNCRPDQHDLNGLKCCTKCPPGSGVVVPCNQDNDTVCAPCRRGEMFSPKDSHDELCKLCRTCPQYSHVKKLCNQSHDTQCECDHNYYFDTLSNSCRNCDNCVMGFGAKRQCDLHRNTVCAQCPEGTYSDMISFDACKVCTSCKTTELTLRYCDSIHNTVCVEMPPAPIESTVVVSTTEVVPEKQKKSTQDKLIPVYCAVLGLVILLLLIYVVVKQVQYRRNPPNNKKNISYLAVTDPAAGGAPATNTGGPLEVNTSGQMQTTNRNQGSDSGVSLEHDSRPITNTMRIKDIPAAKLKAVEQMLHSSLHWRGGWTSFAREIGYSNAKISLFENKASQSGRMPAEILLAEWGKSENVTVEVLVRTLKNCERDDIVTVLYSDVRTHPAFVQQNNANASRALGVSYNNIAGTHGQPQQNPQHLQQNLHNHPQGQTGVPGHINLSPGGHMMMNNPGQGQQMNLGQGQQMNLGQGQQMNLGQGQQLNLGQGQSQQGGNVLGGHGAGHSSVSGSSTTDVSGSGRYGPQSQQTAFQHIVPSYHSVQGGQQMML